MRYRRCLALVLGAMVALSLLGSSAVVPVNAQGGQEAPPEVVVNGLRFALDREVPIALDQLEARVDDDGNEVFIKTAGDPLGAVYVPLDGDPATANRYLPEYLHVPETACPTELVADAGTIQSDGTSFVPLGPEPDLTPESLVEVGATDDGRTIYVPTPDEPFQELFATTPAGGLVRYALVSGTGAPVTLSDPVAFAGQEFAPAAPVDDVSADELVKVGCLGGFPAFAPTADAPYTTIYLQVSGSLISFDATAPVEEPATPPGTPVPTEAGTPAPSPEAPTATTAIEPVPPTEAPTATQEPTAAPTATLEPTPTAEPTATVEPTPQPTATTEPTATPEPTQTPAPTATVPPTAAPTEAAAPTATTPPTVVPTEAPQPTPTPETVSRPTPTPQPRQPQAVVPTLPPEAPPPAVSTSIALRCAGDPGAPDANGLPGRLPTSMQYGGTGYRFSQAVPAADAGSLTRIGCVGAFDLYTSDLEGAANVLFLGLQNAPDTLFRYEPTTSFSVEFEVTNDPRVIRLAGTGDQPDVTYRAGDPMVRSVYSSVTLILFVADASQEQPERVLGYAVDQNVIGEYVPEGAGEQASAEVLAEAEQVGIHGELTLGAGGTRYVLVSLWRPFGTTTNGWIMLYGPEGQAAPEQLVGLDPRRLDLLVFNRSE